MSEDGTDNVRYKAGRIVGVVIWSLFEVMAIVDGTSVEDVVEGWIGSYVTGRIIRPEEGGSE